MKDSIKHCNPFESLAIIFDVITSLSSKYKNTNLVLSPETFKTIRHAIAHQPKSNLFEKLLIFVQNVCYYKQVSEKISTESCSEK